MSLNFKKVNLYSSTYNLLTKEQINSALLPVVVIIPEVEEQAENTGTQITSSAPQQRSLQQLETFAENFVENYEFSTFIYDWQSRSETIELKRAIYRSIELYNFITKNYLRPKKESEETAQQIFNNNIYPVISIEFESAKDVNGSELNGIFVPYTDQSLQYTISDGVLSGEYKNQINITSISGITSIQYVDNWGFLSREPNIEPTLINNSDSFEVVSGVDNNTYVVTARGLLGRLKDYINELEPTLQNDLTTEINELIVVIENYEDIIYTGGTGGSRSDPTILSVLLSLESTPVTATTATVTETFRTDVTNTTLRRR